METVINNSLSVKEKNSLKLRVLSVHEDMPPNYADIVCQVFPEYDKGKVRNVRNTAIADERLTEIFESLAKKYIKLKAELLAEFPEQPSKEAQAG